MTIDYDRTDFGISDSILDSSDKHPWIWFACLSLLCFIVLVAIKPENWMIFIFASLFFAWTSIYLLLLFYVLEKIVWSLVHPAHIYHLLRDVASTKAVKYLTAGCLLLAFVWLVKTIFFADKPELEPYVFTNLNRAQRTFILHLDNECGNSEKVAYSTRDLIYTAMHENKLWTFDYHGSPVPFDFCAKCFPAEKIKFYTDSILHFRQSLLNRRELFEEGKKAWEEAELRVIETEEAFEEKWGHLAKDDF